MLICSQIYKFVHINNATLRQFTYQKRQLTTIKRIVLITLLFLYRGKFRRVLLLTYFAD